MEASPSRTTARKSDPDLLNEIAKVLQDRSNEIETHKQLVHQIVDLRQKVRRQKSQIEQQWKTLIEQEKKECSFLTKEKETIQHQMKGENVTGGRDVLLKSQVESVPTKGGGKPLPSRAGNYTIMARRLQGEIKNLEQNARDMKTRLQQELEKKTTIETKVKEMRSNLTLHRRQDPFTAPTTPVQQ